MKKLLVCLLLAGCGKDVTSDTTQLNRFKLSKEVLTYDGAVVNIIYVLTDKETGKEYIGLRAVNAGIPLTETK